MTMAYRVRRVAAGAAIMVLVFPALASAEDCPSSPQLKVTIEQIVAKSSSGPPKSAVVVAKVRELVANDQAKRTAHGGILVTEQRKETLAARVIAKMDGGYCVIASEVHIKLGFSERVVVHSSELAKDSCLSQEVTAYLLATGREEDLFLQSLIPEFKASYEATLRVRRLPPAETEEAARDRYDQFIGGPVAELLQAVIAARDDRTNRAAEVFGQRLGEICEGRGAALFRRPQRKQQL